MVKHMDCPAHPLTYIPCTFSHCCALFISSFLSLPFKLSSNSFQTRVELAPPLFFPPTCSKMMSGRKVPGSSCLDAVTAPEARLGRGFPGSLLLLCLKTPSPAEQSTTAAPQLLEALYFHCLFRRLFIALA